MGWTKCINLETRRRCDAPSEQDQKRDQEGKGTPEKNKAQTQGRTPSRPARSLLGPHMSSGIAMAGVWECLRESPRRKNLRDKRGAEKEDCGSGALRVAGGIGLIERETSP